MTKKELIEKAKELKIKNYARMKKDELSVAVQTAEVALDEHEKIHQQFSNLNKKEKVVKLPLPEKPKKSKRRFLKIASLLMISAGVWITVVAMWPEPTVTQKVLSFFGF